MPNGDYKSITVSDYVYSRFNVKYHKVKSEMQMQGITSFSGFITFHLAKILELDRKKESGE